MTTIKQVALEAGVSKSTVSRFIAQNGYVSDEAREKIERAIKKLNFRPNLSAQSLKTKKTGLQTGRGATSTVFHPPHASSH